VFTLPEDGKQYIKSVAAGEAIEDPRNQGYTVALQTIFDCLEDMKFFDTECDFHKGMKTIVGPRMLQPPVIVYYKNVVSQL
jgi:hypothetical protein